MGQNIGVISFSQNPTLTSQLCLMWVTWGEPRHTANSLLVTAQRSFSLSTSVGSWHPTADRRVEKQGSRLTQLATFQDENIQTRKCNNSNFIHWYQGFNQYHTVNNFTFDAKHSWSWWISHWKKKPASEVPHYTLLWNFGSLDHSGEMKKTQRHRWLTLRFIYWVYKAWSWKSKIASRLSAQSVAMISLMSLPKCPNYVYITASGGSASICGYLYNNIARVVMQSVSPLVWGLRGKIG